MEKDSKKEKFKLTAKQKEIIITVIVLIACIVVGFYIGKALFNALY